MINNNYIAVFDFETDSRDPHTCSPTELGCVMIEPRKLEIVESSLFEQGMRPEDIDTEGYYERHKETIEWTANNRKTKPEAIIEEWKSYPSPDVTWSAFVSYLEGYQARGSKRKSMFSAPIRAGSNIIAFDDIILKRLCTQYKNIDRKSGKPNIFHPRRS
jgi:hypothetical protein